MVNGKTLSLSATGERWPIAGAFTISRGAKTEAAVIVAEVSGGPATGRGECVPYGRYGESLNFLAVAESRLSAEPFWLAEVHALRGENYRAQGQLQRAQSSYEQALRLNSGNRTANDALARLHVEPAPASR